MGVFQDFLYVLGLKKPNQNIIENNKTNLDINVTTQPMMVASIDTPVPSDKNEHFHHQTTYALDERIRSLVNQNQWYKKFGITALITIVALTASVVYLAVQPKDKPYLMMLDDKGRQIQKITTTNNLNPSQLETIRQNTLVEFITNLKTVTPDIGLQKKMLDSAMVYFLPNGPAEQVIKKYFSQKTNSPYEISRKYLISVEMINILPIEYENSKAYQVLWREHWTDRQGNKLGTTDFNSMVVYEMHPPKDTETALKNPTGFYIKYLTWSMDAKAAKPNQNNGVQP